MLYKIIIYVQKNLKKKKYFAKSITNLKIKGNSFNKRNNNNTNLHGHRNNSSSINKIKNVQQYTINNPMKNVLSKKTNNNEITYREENIYQECEENDSNEYITNEFQNFFKQKKIFKRKFSPNEKLENDRAPKKNKSIKNNKKEILQIQRLSNKSHRNLNIVNLTSNNSRQNSLIDKPIRINYKGDIKNENCKNNNNYDVELSKNKINKLYKKDYPLNDNNSSLETENEISQNIQDLKSRINFTGTNESFLEYIKMIKIKAEITYLLESMFKRKNDKIDGNGEYNKTKNNNYRTNCFEEFRKIKITDEKKENEFTLNIYKYLSDQLIKLNKTRLEREDIS